MADCIVCGEDRWESRWGILCRCRGCGFLRAAEIPSPDAATRLYADRYFSGKEYGNYLADRDVHLRNFAARLRDMHRLAGPLKCVFEIGCAYGLSLDLMSRHQIHAEGLDVCREAVEYAVEQLGQRATVGDFLSTPLTSGAYDAFCLWDTIEHLPQPEPVVQRIAASLRPGGWLFLTTPDTGSLVARWRGRRWRMIHPPTHLYYFSRPTVRQFLKRHGLTVMQVKSVAVFRTLHSVLGGMAALRPGLSGAMAARLKALLPERLQRRVGAWVNLGDIMFVAAMKP